MLVKTLGVTQIVVLINSASRVPAAGAARAHRASGGDASEMDDPTVQWDKVRVGDRAARARLTADSPGTLRRVLQGGVADRKVVWLHRRQGCVPRADVTRRRERNVRRRRRRLPLYSVLGSDRRQHLEARRPGARRRACRRAPVVTRARARACRRSGARHGGGGGGGGGGGALDAD